MELTVKKLRTVINKGGVWILLVNKEELNQIVPQIEREKGSSICKMRCETVEDAIKASLLIESFNTWTLTGIREFMKQHDNYPKIIETEL